ncbi:MAG: transporter substrate-binding protein [Cyanobacteriota bacterium]
MSTIQVGILHSLRGTMAISEAPLVDAALLAIDEINQQGGLLGSEIEPIIEDGASDPERFLSAAEWLIPQVATVFGCWTSLSRKTVLPIFEAANALLWYPVQYEGLEQSPQVFYTGACLNQQVEPALRWLLQQGHRRIFLVGSDYVFPRVAHTYLKGQLHRWGGQLVDEWYVPLGSRQFGGVIQAIQQWSPDAIFNTLNGDSNLWFYTALAEAGICAENMPVMAVSISEVELLHIGSAAVGHYACWGHFQNLPTPANQDFLRRFRRYYGRRRVINDPVATAYTQVYLWWQAAQTAQTVAVEAVRQAAIGQERETPAGRWRIDSNHHVRRDYHIGQIRPDLQFDILASSPEPVDPLPWLGVEQAQFDTAAVVVDLLKSVPQAINDQWLLNQKTEELRRSQKALADANREILQLNQTLQLENFRLSAEVEITRRLQQMILPKDEELQGIPELDIAGFMEPAAEVGGDYYDVLHQNGHVKIGIGDVTGHGLESGVLMIMVQMAVRTLLANGETDSKRFLSILNQVIYENVQRMRTDKNLSLSLLDYHSGQLKLSGQHEELILVRANGQIQRVDTIDLGFPIGLEADISAFVDQHEFFLEPGDGVVLYTDGVTEAENESGEHFGLDRLCQTIGRYWYQSASQIRQAIVKEVRQFIGSQALYDDLTLLVLKKR